MLTHREKVMVARCADSYPPGNGDVYLANTAIKTADDALRLIRENPERVEQAWPAVALAVVRGLLETEATHETDDGVPYEDDAGFCLLSDALDELSNAIPGYMCLLDRSPRKLAQLIMALPELPEEPRKKWNHHSPKKIAVSAPNVPAVTGLVAATPTLTRLLTMLTKSQMLIWLLGQSTIILAW